VFTGSVSITGSLSLNSVAIPTSASLASTYLQLAGGTLTGALNGTSGTFSGNLSGAGFFLANSVNGLVTIQGNAGGNQFNQTQGLAIGWNYSAGGGEVVFSSNKGAGSVGGYKFYDWNGTTATQLLSISPSGSAIFASSVTAGGNLQVAGANTATPLGVKTNTNQNWRILDNSGAQFDCVNDALDTRVDFRVGAQLYIAASGNVGIGTTSPAFKLHTVGAGFIGRQNNYGSYDAADADLIISNYNSDNTSLLLFNSAGAYNSGLINYYNNTLSLGLNNSNSTNSIVTSTSINITATGVGIGTTSPAHKLDVIGDIAIPSSNYIQYYTGASYYGRIQLWNSANGDMTFQNASGGTSHMIFLPQGNVGIGTTSPTTKLQVAGETTTSILTAANETNGQFQSRINGNSVNSQGACRWRTYARGIVATGTGTKLRIPFVDQGNLNIVTVARVIVCAADFNSSGAPSAQFMFSVGSLNALSNLQILSSGGSYSSATTSGMTVVVTISSLSAAYIVIEYLTPEPSYSIDLGNITLTS
jgi:hypothetical protein